MTRVVLATGNNGVSLQLEYGSLVDAATGGAITSSTTQVKVSQLDVYVKAGSFSFYDTSNKLVVAGTLVNDTTFTNVNLDNMSAWTDRKIATCTSSPMTLSYAGAQNGTFNASLQDVGYSGTMAGYHIFTVPRRPYTAPATPSVSISNGTGSCTGHQLDIAKDKFWSQTDWQLETNGTFQDLAMNSAGNRTSVTYTPVANSRHRLAVRAKNPNAAGSYGYSGYYYTTPSAISSLTANRPVGSKTVNLAWKNNARYQGAVKIYRKLNGGTETLIHTASGTATTYSTTLELDDSATYRVRGETPQGVNKVSGSYSNSATASTGYSVPAKPGVSLSNVSGKGRVTLTGHQRTPTTDKYWGTIDWEMSIDDGDWGGGATGLSGATTTLDFTLAADNRYQVRARAVNAGGAGPWGYSGYLYTPPTAPTGLHGDRQFGTNEVRLWTDDWSQWTSLIRVERSTNGGSSWTVLGSYTPGNTYVDLLSPAQSALYRFQGQTGAPIVSSEYSNELFVSAVLVTDKTKLPGVNRIYVGEDRARQIFAGAARVWTDGDA